MSRPSPGPTPASSVQARHSRNNSGTASPLPSVTSKAPSKRQPDAVQPAPQPERKVHYTLIIRLPFPRGNFEDPPQVDWNADKDRRLWRIIANTSKIGDLNWEKIAREFGVELNFILQQAAWLYQRHMDNVREQMKKVGASTAGGSTAGTPVPGQPGTSTVGGIPMKRLGSGGSSRAPSSLSLRTRESPNPMGRVDTAIPGSPRTAAPPLSRTPSTTTVTQSKFAQTSPRQPIQRSFRTANPSGPSRLSPALETKSPKLHSPTEETVKSSPAASDSSSSSSDSDTGPTRRSHIFARRPQPRFSSRRKSSLAHAHGADEEGDGDDDGGSSEESPLFATAAAAAAAAAAESTSKAPALPPRDRASTLTKAAAPPSSAEAASTEDETSTASSQQSPPAARPATRSHHQTGSPARRQHRHNLARLQSPSGRGASDGTPSMGSSFSDLDDTSITQSALEEALASNLRHGGASRFSAFGGLGLGGPWRGKGAGTGTGAGAAGGRVG